MNFYHKLYEGLLKSGFQPADSLIKNEHRQINRLRGLIKTDGPVWYVIVISYDKNISQEELLNANEYLEAGLTSLIKAYKVRSLIALNLIISDEISEELRLFTDSTGAFYDNPINYVYWAVNKNTGEIYVNKNQPSKLMNLEKLIPLCASEDSQHEELPVTEKKKGDFFITYFLIFINCLVFALLELNGGSDNIRLLIGFGAIEPGRIIEGHEYYRLITAMFLHGGLRHLVYNCFSLYIFGTRVEEYYGIKSFLVIYLLSGIAGGIFSVLFTRSVSVGASGAIFGLVGAIAALTYKSKGYSGGLNIQAMVIYILISIGFGFLDDGIDNFGHLGGLIAGTLISFIILSFNKREKRSV